MKYLFLIVLLVGCDSKEEPSHKDVIVDTKPAYNFIEEELTDLLWQNGDPYGGVIYQTGDNDWYFETHTNVNCVGVLKGSCRKSAVMFTEGDKVSGRITKYSFDIKIVKYNTDDSPEWLIVWEIWARLFNQKGGNHPPQTIKLLNDNGQLKYCGFDNEWQFKLNDASELGHSPDGSTHPHPDDRNNGCANTELNIFNHIDLYVWDDGRTAFYVDDILVFDKGFQTKKEGKKHLMFWGPYWSLGYNKEIDPLKSIELVINGFTRSVYIP